MKKINNNIFYTLLSGLLLILAACSNTIEDREASPVIASDCQGAFFPSENETYFEFEPNITSFTYTVSRVKKSGTASIPLIAKTNTDNVFVVPETVDFADGVDTTEITISFPTAKEGIDYTLELTFPDEYIDFYNVKTPGITLSLLRIKWSEVKMGVWQDGAFTYLFGFPANTTVMAVDYQVAELGENKRYRILNPYKIATEYVEGTDIPNGFLYNEEGDMLDIDVKFIIDVINEKASLTPTLTGMNWAGFGAFSMGSIYGNVSKDEEKYPLGKVEEGIITFGKNSLYLDVPEGENEGLYPVGAVSVFYDSIKRYQEATSNE